MLWRQAPARRGMVLRRHSASKLVALGEHWLSLLWALATGVAALGSATFLIPVALVARNAVSGQTRAGPEGAAGAARRELLGRAPLPGRAD